MTVAAQAKNGLTAEPCGSTGRLIIDRPPLNILDLDAICDLRVRLAGLLDEPSVRVIELRGLASAFCAGVEIRDHFPARAPRMLREFHALIRSELYARVPVIAVVQGHCLGGGLEMAMAADFVIASEEAAFGQPEIKVGCFAPAASVLLPRLIPEKKALEMLLTGMTISAGEAERLGLVNRVAPAGRIDAEVDRFRAELLAQSPSVLALARKAARLGSRALFEGALREAERLYVDELIGTHDAVEGLTAFLEKRGPRWEGR